MDKINEARVLTNIRLSQIQKFILSKLVLPNTTPLTSYDRISSGKNLVANRDILVKLGMLQMGENEANITQIGKEALQKEALIDDTGKLTTDGEQYAYAEKVKDVAAVVVQTQKPEEPNVSSVKRQEPDNVTPSASIATQSDSEVAPSFESWSMISEMQYDIIQKRFVRNYSKKS